MKNFFVILFVCPALLIFEVKGKNVFCEEIKNYDWSLSNVGTQKTCDMKTATAIRSTGISISAARDDTVGAIYFDHNKNIRFLPEYPASSFPKLVLYTASNCSIESISRSNFKNLELLQQLYLAHNHLTRIESNTFDDLRSLNHLYLHDNRINYLNGAAFTKLIKLTSVWLFSNNCINEDFEYPSQIATMPETVGKHCGFTETHSKNVQSQKQLREEQTKALEVHETHHQASIQQVLETQKAQLELYKSTQSKFEALRESQQELAVKLDEYVAKTNELQRRTAEDRENLHDILQKLFKPTLDELKAHRKVAEGVQSENEAIFAKFEALLKSQEETSGKHVADQRQRYRPN